MSRHSGNRQPLLPVVFIAGLTLLLAGALVKGPFLSVDTWKFLTAGDELIRSLILGQGTLEDMRRPALFPYYVISSVLLSAVHSYLDLREWGVVAFNSALFALITCAVFWSWRSLYRELDRPWDGFATVAGVCGGMYLIYGLPDGFLWSYAVLTDMLFLFWIVLFVAFAVRGIQGGGAAMWWLALLMAGTAPFVRPPGLIAPLLFCVALALYLAPPRHLKRIAAGVVIVPALLVVVVAPALVLLHDSSMVELLVPASLERSFRQSVTFFEQGIVISNRLELEDAGPSSYGDILKTIGYRLVYFLVPLRFGEHAYSTVHNAINAVYMLLALPLAVKGMHELVNAGRRHAMLALFLFAVAYGFALLHAVTLVSYDWRYQLPAMVPLWIFAGCGLFGMLGFRLRPPAGGERPGAIQNNSPGSEVADGVRS